jgi:hypothetical protein
MSHSLGGQAWPGDVLVIVDGFLPGGGDGAVGTGVQVLEEFGLAGSLMGVVTDVSRGVWGMEGTGVGTQG